MQTKKNPKSVKSLSMEAVKGKVAQLCPTDSETLWTIQSMEFSRPEYWSGQPFPSLGDLPNLGIKPRSPTLQAVSLPAESPEKPKNTGVGRVSLLQWIIPTQGSNWGVSCMAGRFFTS